MSRRETEICLGIVSTPGCSVVESVADEEGGEGSDDSDTLSDNSSMVLSSSDAKELFSLVLTTREVDPPLS